MEWLNLNHEVQVGQTVRADGPDGLYLCHLYILAKANKDGEDLCRVLRFRPYDPIIDSQAVREFSQSFMEMNAHDKEKTINYLRLLSTD